MDVRTNYADVFFREADSLSVLEQNVKDFPASAVARFSLLCRYKKNNSPEFEKFADQTSLYFNNSYWLREQLAQAGIKEALPSEFAGELSNTRPETENEKEFLPENDSPESTTIEEIEQPEEKMEVIDEELPVPVPEEFGQIDNNTESHESDVTHDQVVRSDDGAGFSVSPESIAAEVKTDEFFTPVAANTDATNGQENHPRNLTSGKEESVLSKEIEDSPVEHNTPIDETLSENSEISKQTPEQELHELTASSISEEDPQETLAAVETSENEEDEQDPIAFEPLHTIDYFASQGIKIKQEDLTDDKLGQQVKSFTAWLKSMKKLHPGKLPEQNEVIERIIQSSAEQSNADAEVLTEAMAEVLIKQNKVEKAVEMYQKLSLINPSKSTYFAAKIESLKTN